MDGIAIFIILGALGGLLRLLVHTGTLAEALTYANSKWVVVGAISGLSYYFLYADYGFPNSFMAIVVGYTGADIIEAGSKKLNKMLNDLFKP
jgi:ABC-type spermidine/putrescine transport system permease subunit II